jgi:acetyl esterase/lipase
MNTATLSKPKIEPVSFASDEHLERRVKDFLHVISSLAPLEEMSPYNARKVLEEAQASVKVDLSGIEVSEKTITTDGYTIPLQIVRPAGERGVLPLFIFIHGGGWVLGDFPTHQRMVRDLVVLSGAAAIFVNYTRTPDAQFPTAINEIFAATKWIAENGKDLNVDGRRLAVVGNSVGGNMTAVTTLKAKENGGPHISLQILFWPIVDANFETESYRRFGKDRFLTTPLMQWMYDMYIKEPEKRRNVLASPLHASLEQLKGLPPAFIAVAENDVLRDEGEAYARKLDEAGVNVTSMRYNGMIHDFGMLNGLAELPATKSLMVHAAAELKEYLFKKTSV